MKSSILGAMNALSLSIFDDSFMYCNMILIGLLKSMNYAMKIFKLFSIIEI